MFIQSLIHCTFEYKKNNCLNTFACSFLLSAPVKEFFTAVENQIVLRGRDESINILNQISSKEFHFLHAHVGYVNDFYIVNA